MTEKEIKAWHEGVATTSTGKIVINRVEGEADVVRFRFNEPPIASASDSIVANWTVNELLANAQEYDIINVMPNDDDSIAYVVLQKGHQRRIIRCFYESVLKHGFNYKCLRRVGRCVVEGMEYTNVESNLKLQSKTGRPTYSADGLPIRIEPDDDYDGLSDVLMLTSSNFLAENIKRGVDLWGITGTYDGGGGGGFSNAETWILLETQEVNNG